jgi:hypothetical protein
MKEKPWELVGNGWDEGLSWPSDRHHYYCHSRDGKMDGARIGASGRDPGPLILFLMPFPSAFPLSSFVNIYRHELADTQPLRQFFLFKTGQKMPKILIKKGRQHHSNHHQNPQTHMHYFL